jgi:glutathione S-transferase
MSKPNDIPEFIVHSVPGSPYGRSVFVLLMEKGARYRLAPVTPQARKSEPHISRHPFGRVPVLEHSDFLLYETQAILRYLDRILPQPALTPAEPRAAARMDQVMNICDWYLFNGVCNVIAFRRLQGTVAAARWRIISCRGERDAGRHHGRAATRFPGRHAGVAAVGRAGAKSRFLARPHECARKLHGNHDGAHRGIGQRSLIFV